MKTFLFFIELPAVFLRTLCEFSKLSYFRWIICISCQELTLNFSYY